MKWGHHTKALLTVIVNGYVAPIAFFRHLAYVATVSSRTRFTNVGVIIILPMSF
jgi:hypothetical protein